MHNDTDHPLILLRDILEHPDTGFISIPAELVGVKQAAPRYGVSERTMQRDCKEAGLAILEGKTYLIVVQAADAFYGNDTGPLHHAQYDIDVIRKLTGWRVSSLAPEEAQLMSVSWIEMSKQEATMQSMQPTFSPSQRFPETMRMKLPEGMTAVLQFAASRRAQSTSAWIRQVLLDRLHQEGLVIMDTGAVRRPEDI